MPPLEPREHEEGPSLRIVITALGIAALGAAGAYFAIEALWSAWIGQAYISTGRGSTRMTHLVKAASDPWWFWETIVMRVLVGAAMFGAAWMVVRSGVRAREEAKVSWLVILGRWAERVFPRARYESRAGSRVASIIMIALALIVVAALYALATMN